MWSRHSWRAVLTHLSAKAFAFGVWVGVLMTRAPSLRSAQEHLVERTRELGGP